MDEVAPDNVWAWKAWRAFVTFNSYAQSKAEDRFRGDLFHFCDGGDGTIPRTWVALHESESTDTNRRYKRLRTLPVDTNVERSGALYMPAHIKIEAGGSPAPRIHFVDDTAGATGKIHVGWLGHHLDNDSKS